jgi:hypothetical protein
MVLFAVIPLAQACRGGPYVAERFDQDPAVDRARVLLVSDDLVGVIQADRPIAEWTTDGRLLAKVQLRNTSPDPLHVLILTQFKDRQDNLIEQEAVWEHVLLHGYATQNYSRPAMSEQAHEYVVQIKKAQVQ